MINLPPEPNCEVTVRTPEGKLPLEEYLRLRGFIKEVCTYCTPSFVRDDSTRLVMCDKHQIIDEAKAAEDFKNIRESIDKILMTSKQKRINDERIREIDHRETLLKGCMSREERRKKKRIREKKRRH